MRVRQAVRHRQHLLADAEDRAREAAARDAETPTDRLVREVATFRAENRALQERVAAVERAPIFTAAASPSVGQALPVMSLRRQHGRRLHELRHGPCRRHGSPARRIAQERRYVFAPRC